uniref:DDX53 protein n=1 Tax=Fopius arisanus TaxID=64838 RepID=A0A0C9QDC7_9HYME
MSSVVKPMKFDYLTNKGVEKFIFSDDDDNDFDFKYVPPEQFKHILKDVRRQRSQRNDEKLWSDFVTQRIPLEPLKHPLKSDLSDINLESFPPVAETQRISKSTRKSRVPAQESKDLSRRSSITFVPQDDDDDDVSTLERSPVSKLDVKSKHSSSESTIKSTHRKNRLLRKVNRLECNSSPDLSSQYESGDDEEFLEVQPHPVIAQKILGLQGRISEILDDISYRLCRIPRPDGENDLKRRQKRLVEFGIRFSRNYLYELGRQVGDIQKHLKAVLEGKGRRGTILHMQALEQKLCASHQLLVCALNAYCNHIPSSVLEEYPGKLKEILGVVVELKDACGKINITADGVGGGDTGSQGLGNDLQSRCYAILSKLRLHSDSESQLFSARQSVVTGPFGSNVKRQNGLKGFPNRLSMYSMDSKCPKTQRQRRPVTVGVCPKDRGIPRVSLNNPPPTPEQIYTNSVGRKSSKESTRKRSHGVHGDDIKTMMDIIAREAETARNSSDLGNVDNFGMMNQGSRCVSRKFHPVTSNESKISIRRRAKNLGKNSKTSVKTSKTSVNGIDEGHGADERLANLVPVIADLMSLVANKRNNGEKKSESSMTSLLEIINNCQQSNSNCTTRSKTNGRASDSRLSDARTGPENMQLICLSQNDETTSKYMDASCQVTQENSRLIERKDCGLTELIVSDRSSQVLMKYRDEYNASSRSSPMYTSNSPNKPWEVVAWIADKLVDELIVNISKELQIDDIIKKLFELEFLEF